MTHVKIISFTESGGALGARLAALLPGMLVERYARGTDVSLANTVLSRFAQQAIFDCNGIIFIGAAGIAVRAVSPYLRNKAEDPAVIVIDEAGKFVIPLLSGHLGGANMLALRLAEALGAQPVLTTATDVRGVFAVDTWAQARELTVLEPGRIRDISGALLRGETVGLESDFPLYGAPPDGVVPGATAQSGIVIACSTAREPFAHTLHLTPRVVVAGIGCRRGKSEADLRRALENTLCAQRVPRQALCAIATISLKKDEPGLLALCRSYGLPLLDFSAETLRQAAGDFTPSTFVAQTVGVDNVCERAAVCGAEGGALMCTKAAADGVTVALAVKKLEVAF